MAAPEELAACVAALETQMRELADRVRHSEQDAAAACVLAGGAGSTPPVELIGAR